jgi:hypothetical protein
MLLCLEVVTVRDPGFILMMIFYLRQKRVASGHSCASSGFAEVVFL